MRRPVHFLALPASSAAAVASLLRLATAAVAIAIDAMPLVVVVAGLGRLGIGTCRGKRFIDGHVSFFFLPPPP